MFYSHTPQPPQLLFVFLSMQATPDTFHLLNSHWMENSWIRDCPEHIMPNPSINSHLPLPFLTLSSAFPCSPSSFKVGLCSWNKRKTACMRTCFSPIWYSLPLLFLWIHFPTLAPWWHSGVMAGSAFDKLKMLRYYAADSYGQECIKLNCVSELLLYPDSQPCSPAELNKELWGNTLPHEQYEDSVTLLIEAKVKWKTHSDEIVFLTCSCGIFFSWWRAYKKEN